MKFKLSLLYRWKKSWLHSPSRINKYVNGRTYRDESYKNEHGQIKIPTLGFITKEEHETSDLQNPNSHAI
ncbi:hypothetical protein RJT34_30181 [Clitoria ternatea]|uniref:Uncharacterized protein n=1 Tax=Clitoria ternatea TaxID=43366 RepID=A0AAN9EU47_CLITE